MNTSEKIFTDVPTFKELVAAQIMVLQVAFFISLPPELVPMPLDTLISSKATVLYKID